MEREREGGRARERERENCEATFGAFPSASVQGYLYSLCLLAGENFLYTTIRPVCGGGGLVHMLPPSRICVA